jgi:hypothetical protein
MFRAPNRLIRNGLELNNESGSILGSWHAARKLAEATYDLRKS